VHLAFRIFISSRLAKHSVLLALLENTQAPQEVHQKAIAKVVMLESILTKVNLASTAKLESGLHHLVLPRSSVRIVLLESTVPQVSCNCF
jgi:hypothetical protein